MAGGMGAGGACMTGGMHGRSMNVGACMAGGMHMVGGVHSGGYVWHGSFVAGETATESDGTHPTGMHSCFKKQTCRFVMFT